MSGSGDGTVKLWETATGACLRTLDGHEGPVLAVCWSADGQHVLSASRDRNGPALGHRTGAATAHVRGPHRQSAGGGAQTPTDSTSLSGSADRTLELWDTATGRCLHVFEGHQGGVTSVCFSAGGGYVLSGSEDRTIRSSGSDNTAAVLLLWKVTRGPCIRCAYCWASERSPADLLSASADTTLALWTIPDDQYAPYVLSRVLPSDTALSAWTDYERSLKRARQALAAGEPCALPSTCARRVRSRGTAADRKRWLCGAICTSVSRGGAARRLERRHASPNIPRR